MEALLKPEPKPEEKPEPKPQQKPERKTRLRRPTISNGGPVTLFGLADLKGQWLSSTSNVLMEVG